MQSGPFGIVSWWQISMFANAINSLALFGLVLYIGRRLLGTGELRKNKLALATMAVAFVLGLQRGLQVLSQVIGLTGPDGAAFAAQQRNVWWLAMAQVLVSSVAVYFLLNRRSYGRLLIEAFLFDAFTQQQHLAALKVQLELRSAQEAAESDRDFHANLMRTMNQNSHSLVQVKDLEGRYLMVNAAFERTFQVLETDILGQTVAVIDPAHAAEFRARDDKARAGVFRTEETARTPDGLHYLDTVRFPIYTGRGDLKGTASISLDVTELRRIITELRIARDAALAAGIAKSEFLATMSHEIRTPMNAVIGMTDLLLHSDMNEQQRELLDTVESSGNALLVLIDDILDLSKMEAGEMKIVLAPFNLRTMIEECVDLVGVSASTKGLDLISYLDDSCPVQVLGDAVRLRQICINLLANAIKFTSEGEVLITARATPTPHGQLELAIEVADTGIGISAEGVEQLFQAFSQVDAAETGAYGGTGLGLVISRRLARAMGGDISVVSRPGNGSAFTATAVVDRVSGVSSVTDAPQDNNRLAGVRVLLVDDNATNLRMVELQLEDLGMRCTPYLSSREALAAVEGGRRFDLAVLDVNMPQLSGHALAVKLRNMPQTASMPIILVTSAIGPMARIGTVATTVLATPIKRVALTRAVVSAMQTRALPFVVDPPAPLAVPVEERLHVLLAEDNLVNQRVAQLMLVKLGHTVHTVDDGAKACDALREAPYDVVLMDVSMPVMNGLEATRKIRTDLPEGNQPYIIALTADATEENRVACVAAGMNGHLNKPVHIQQLKATLGRPSHAA
jgi:PAS domain S-box-containing protein